MNIANETEARVRRILSEQVGLPADLPSDKVFYDRDVPAAQAECDSLDFVEYIMALEEEFGIEIPDADCPPLVTINATLAYLERARA